MAESAIENTVEAIQRRLSLPQAVEVLQGTWSKKTLLAWITRGSYGRKLPAIKVANRWYVTVEDLEEFVRGHGAGLPQLSNTPAAEATNGSTTQTVESGRASEELR